MYLCETPSLYHHVVTITRSSHSVTLLTFEASLLRKAGDSSWLSTMTSKASGCGRRSFSAKAWSSADQPQSRASSRHPASQSFLSSGQCIGVIVREQHAQHGEPSCHPKGRNVGV